MLQIPEKESYLWNSPLFKICNTLIYDSWSKEEIKTSIWKILKWLKVKTRGSGFPQLKNTCLACSWPCVCFPEAKEEERGGRRVRGLRERREKRETGRKKRSQHDEIRGVWLKQNSQTFYHNKILYQKKKKEKVGGSLKSTTSAPQESGKTFQSIVSIYNLVNLK